MGNILTTSASTIIQYGGAIGALLVICLIALFSAIRALIKSYESSNTDLKAERARLIDRNQQLFEAVNKISHIVEMNQLENKSILSEIKSAIDSIKNK